MNERKLHDSDNSELYTYDSAYRLTNFDRGTLNAGGTTITTPTSTTDALQNRNWTLDGVGNWQQNDVLQEGAILQTETRQHTNFNEIATDAGTSLDHDDNGNLINDGTYLFRWDANNRLRTVTRASDNSLIAAYTYDCQNRRHSKEVITGNGSLITDHSLLLLKLARLRRTHIRWC